MKRNEGKQVCKRILRTKDTKHLYKTLSNTEERGLPLQ